MMTIERIEERMRPYIADIRTRFSLGVGSDVEANEEINHEVATLLHEQVNSLAPLHETEERLNALLRDRGILHQIPRSVIDSLVTDFQRDRPGRPFGPALQEEADQLFHAGVSRDVAKTAIVALDILNEGKERSVRVDLPVVDVEQTIEHDLSADRSNDGRSGGR